MSSLWLIKAAVYCLFAISVYSGKHLVPRLTRLPHEQLPGSEVAVHMIVMGCANPSEELCLLFDSLKQWCIIYLLAKSVYCGKHLTSRLTWLLHKELLGSKVVIQVTVKGCANPLKERRPLFDLLKQLGFIHFFNFAISIYH